MAAYVPRALLANSAPANQSAVIVAQGPLSGGFITNSAAAGGNLLVDMVTTPITLGGGGSQTTFAIQPGQTFYIPPLNAGVTVRVSSGILQVMGIIGAIW